ncbi:hypothetical protein SAMD00019534_021110 [Acytostelium subglobosum LB1]|uniref:hypothetical protein n=1 Tax=Acytostelium subglobosum LB1 TaxID=1410327 RepID=UPI000645178B|nr:hypothetical protein SAMD00019534_021110 [Acytostelium subglobosum LB1]GAM18936.1 hypothetical protein SAMD00019534_021110 [Acytostelium subglobosum LB1]|eukprot:XP_012758156.1 hypothetical protein SAMD00019534_021110 [Acytostelium subglobosum LB1]
MQQYYLDTDVNGKSFWISGECANGQASQFYYSSGPENGQLMYDVNTEECGFFCSWNIVEPSRGGATNQLECNVAIDFAYIGARETGKEIGYWNNLGWNSSNVMILCEYGGMDSPFITPARSAGENVQMTNILNMALLSKSADSIQVNFVNIDGVSPSFLATNVKAQTDTSLSMDIPPGSGMYSVTISITGSGTLKTSFQYRPPILSIVKPSFIVGSTMTLIGDNFVDGKTSVFLTNASVPCTNVFMIKQGMITCQLTQDHQASVLVPITIATDSVYNIMNKPAFMDSTTGNYYSCFRTFTDQAGSQSFSHSQAVQGMSGFVSYVGTDTLYKLVQKMCPSTLRQFVLGKLDTQNILYFTSLSRPSGGSNIITTDEPNKNSLVTLSPTIPTTGSGSIFFFTPFLGYSTYDAAAIVGFNAASFTQLFYPSNIDISAPTTPTTLSVATTGGPVTIPLSHIGTPLDDTFITYMGTKYPLTSRDYYGHSVQFNVPPGTGTQTLQVSFQASGSTTPTASTSITVQYSAAVISDMSSVGSNGGVVTITSSGLGSDVSAIVVTIGSITCTGVAYTTTADQITCTLPSPTSGNLQSGVPAIVTVSGTPSGTFTYQFLPPVITSTTPGTIGKTSLITITGKYFSPSFLSVTIDSAACSDPSYISDTAIACSFVGGNTLPTDPLMVSVTNQGLVASNKVFTYNIPPAITTMSSVGSNGGVVSMTGTKLGADASKIVIKIGGVTCSDVTMVTADQQLTCRLPEPTVGNLQDGLPATLSVDDASALQTYTYTFLPPVITSTTNGSIGKTTSIIITGQYFSASFLSVTIGGATCKDPILIKDTAIECSFDGGATLPIDPLLVSVTNQGLEGNGKVFTYNIPPAITTMSSVGSNGGVVSMIGTAIGSDASKVVVKIGGVTCSDIVIVTPDQELTCVLPEPIVGSLQNGLPATLTVDGVTSLQPSTYTFLPPVIIATTPGSIGKTSFITIIGKYFSASFLSVTIDGASCSDAIYINDTAVQCSYVGATAMPPDPLMVSVTNQGLEGNGKVFTYYTPPAIISMTSVGSNGGLVSMNGIALGADSSKVAITIGGVACSDVNIVTSDQQLTCTLPEPTSGDLQKGLPVKVNVDGVSSLQSFNYTFLAPVINDTTQGLLGKTTLITIIGNYFSQSFLSVTIDGATCKSPICINSTAISCSFDGGNMMPPGPLMVRVSNQGLQSSNNVFYYNNTPPAIILMTPVGSNGGVVSVSGTAFGSDASQVTIAIGGVSCSSVVILTTNKLLTCFLPSPTSGNLQKGLEATMMVNGATSLQSYNYTFLSPVINLATPGALGQTALITITGNYFSSSFLSVAIDGSPCYNSSIINATMIQCYFDGPATMPATTSIESLPVLVMNQGLQGMNKVFYYTNNTQLDCNGHGVSKGGKCVCDPGWTMQTCTMAALLAAPPTIEKASVLSPSDGEITFKTSLAFIREFGQLGNQIKSLTMSSIVWSVVSGPPNTYHWLGSFPGEAVQVDLHIDYYKDGGQVQFAGEDMHIGDNSVKFTIGIRSWPFANRQSSMQLVFESRTSKDDGGCGKTKSQNTFNSYYVVSGSSVLYGSFANHLLVDGRVVKSTFQDIDSKDSLYSSVNGNGGGGNGTEFQYLSAVQIPYFEKECTIDPSFQSLITVENNDKCPAKSYTKIIIIVVCTVCGAAIVLTAALLIKKYKYRLMFHAPSSVLKMKHVH